MFNKTELVSEEIKAGKTYVTINVSGQEDDIAFRTVSYSKPRFIPPVTKSELNGEKRFSYDVMADDYQCLSRLAKDMSAANFLLFMKNITDAIIQSVDYFLNSVNFLISENYIYVNTENFDVRLIYMFSQECSHTEDDINRQIYELACNLSRRFSGNPPNSEWQEIISFLWNMPGNISVFEANAKYTDLLSAPRRGIQPSASQSIPPTPYVHVQPMPQPINTGVSVPAQQPAPVAPPAKKQGLFGGGAPRDKKEEMLKNKKQKADKSGEKAAPVQQGGLFSGNKQPPSVDSSPVSTHPPADKGKALDNPKSKPAKDTGGLFGKKKKSDDKHPKADIPIQQPFGSNYASESDLTDVDFASAYPSGAVIYILEQGVRVACIPINKSVFVIGRSAAETDYCFNSENDKTISRRHFQINYTGNQYSITHISATAGVYTYVNANRRLAANESILLENGDIIRVGKRELQFELV